MSLKDSLVRVSSHFKLATQTQKIFLFTKNEGPFSSSVVAVGEMSVQTSIILYSNNELPFHVSRW